MINKNLLNLRSSFKNKLIDKSTYIQKMHRFHRILFQYPDLIKNSQINNILITDKDVYFSINQTNLKIVCDKNDYRQFPIEILNFNAYEPGELTLALKMIKENDTVFDIGANIGWFSLNIARIAKAKVYAFEPIPKTYYYLKKNIKLNNLVNIYPHIFGFSDKNSIIDFYFYPQGSGNASILNLTKKRAVEKISCPVKTIDWFIGKKNIVVDFIKCDIEGAELFVYKGAENTIKKHKPIVLSEMLRKWTKPFGYNPNDIIYFFNKLDYLCFINKRNHLVRFSRMTELTKETNFFFLNKYKHINLINKLAKISY